MTRQEIDWQPISYLFDLADSIDRMYLDGKEQVKSISRLKHSPKALNEETLEKVVTQYCTQVDDYWRMEQQLLGSVANIIFGTTNNKSVSCLRS
jgi:hypothetical protein